MATAKYNLHAIFAKAWMTAKQRARDAYRNGYVADLRPLFRAALREAWAFEKRLRIEMAASNARVQAAIEQIKASHSAEGQAKRAADMAGWQARSGMPQRSYGRAWR